MVKPQASLKRQRKVIFYYLLGRNWGVMFLTKVSGDEQELGVVVVLSGCKQWLVYSYWGGEGSVFFFLRAGDEIPR